MKLVKTLCNGNHLEYELRVFPDGSVDIPHSIMCFEPERNMMHSMIVKSTGASALVQYTEGCEKSSEVDILDFDYTPFSLLDSLEREVKTEEIMPSIIKFGIDKCRLMLNSLNGKSPEVGLYKIKRVWYKNGADYKVELEPVSNEHNKELSTFVSTIATGLNDKSIECVGYGFGGDE